MKASFVLADGARASALNVNTYVDADTIRWQSTNRELAGELQPKTLWQLAMDKLLMPNKWSVHCGLSEMPGVLERSPYPPLS